VDKPAARIAVYAMASVLCTGLLVGVGAGQQIYPRIINGIPTDEFESVGIVGTVELGGFCSGTLISPLHVLTAAHCAELAVGPRDGAFELDGRLYTTSQIYIHPDFNSRTLDNDLAIYELREAVEGIIPSPINRTVPRVGQLLTLVGFGAGGGGPEGEDGTFGVKMVGVTEIEEVTETLIIWRFDSNDESNTAPGDSGAPCFLDFDGEFIVAAVASGGTEPDAGFGDVAFNTRVDAFADWIDSVVLSGEPPEETEEPVEDDTGCPAHNMHRPGHHLFHPPGHHFALPPGLQLIFSGVHGPFKEFRPGGHKRPVHGPRPDPKGRPAQGVRAGSDRTNFRPPPLRGAGLPSRNLRFNEKMKQRRGR
jgi:secreted trypsin-like serine protease